MGVESRHIDAPAVPKAPGGGREGTQNRLQLTREEQLRILTRLTDAVVFEEFIRKKFVGAKSFSLEGSESLIPLLDLAIEKAGDQGLRKLFLVWRIAAGSTCWQISSANGHNKFSGNLRIRAESQALGMGT